MKLIYMYTNKQFASVITFYCSFLLVIFNVLGHEQNCRKFRTIERFIQIEYVKQIFNVGLSDTTDWENLELFIFIESWMLLGFLA